MNRRRILTAAVLPTEEESEVLERYFGIPRGFVGIPSCFVIGSSQELRDILEGNPWLRDGWDEGCSKKQKKMCSSFVQSLSQRWF